MAIRTTFRASAGDTILFLPFIGDGDGNLLIGTAGDDTLDGLGGDDVLLGGGGADALNGGDGLDLADYASAASGVVVRLNLGLAPDDGDGAADILTSIENVTGSALDDILIGAAGANTLTGGVGQDYLIGLGGDDILIGGAGAANQLQGGLGDDDYHVSANDTVVEFADEGHDRVFTDRARLTLSTNVENLTYTGAGGFIGVGNGGDNVITGGAGDDVLSGAGGLDTLDGGDGLDTADYSRAASIVVASLADDGAQDDGDGSMDTFAGIENLTGSAYDDDLTGDAASNVLDGGSGDDLLIGHAGNDTLRGGGGYDLVDYGGAVSGVFVRLNVGQASDGEGGTDTLISIEDLDGSDHDDVLIGSTLDNYMYGGEGRDVLVGLEGDDLLEGGAGAPNQLQGGLGDDRYYVEANDTVVEFENEGFDSVATTLNRYVLRANFEELAFDGTGDFVGVGNAGDNFIYGGEGDDVLTGGQGDDVLIGTSSCGCDGDGGVDTAVLSGVLADYLIEDLGGAWGVTDNVVGRDGSDLLLDIDQIRFSDGSVLLLEPFVAPAAPDKYDPAVLSNFDGWLF